MQGMPDSPSYVKGGSREAGETVGTASGDLVRQAGTLSPIVAKESGLFSSAANPFGRLQDTLLQSDVVIDEHGGLTTRLAVDAAKVGLVHNNDLSGSRTECTGRT